MGKLVRVPYLIEDMWRPQWVSKGTFLIGVIGVAILELCFSLSVVFNPEPTLFIIGVGVLLYIGLSIYGTLALQKAGIVDMVVEQHTHIETYSGRGTAFFLVQRAFLCFSVLTSLL